jgi:hypothetical protein
VGKHLDALRYCPYLEVLGLRALKAVWVDQLMPVLRKMKKLRILRIDTLYHEKCKAFRLNRGLLEVFDSWPCIEEVQVPFVWDNNVAQSEVDEVLRYFERRRIKLGPGFKRLARAKSSGA